MLHGKVSYDVDDDDHYRTDVGQQLKLSLSKDATVAVEAAKDCSKEEKIWLMNISWTFPMILVLPNGQRLDLVNNIIEVTY